MLPQVLMLGWEYPPYINGGLGVASHALAEALERFVNLKVILPNAQGIPAGAPTILGLDQLSGGEWEAQQASSLRIPVELRAYAGVADEDTQGLYSGNLLKRVAHYETLARRIARSERFDLVHAHDWMTFPAAIGIKRERQKPAVLHVHSLEYDRSGSGPDAPNWIYEIEKEAFKEADLIIPVSEYTSNILEKVYEVPKAKIFPVHNAIVPRKAVRLPKPFPEQLVVFMGRITGQKGPERFLNAALSVLEHFDKVRFMMAGQGDQREVLMRLAAKAKIGDRFHSMGFLSASEKQRMLAMADVFVMPSMSEPFGLVALEAAQMGVPCVISKRSGVQEVLPAAISIDPDNLGELTHYLLSLLKYPTLGRVIVERQKQNLLGLDWEKAAMKIVTAYRERL